jgi:tetratricopeptide (TPR) repeat protein
MYLKAAIARLSAEYTRPRNTEAVYQLGLALRAQHKDDEAYAALYRATWDQAFHAAAYYQLAEISASRGDDLQALDHVNRCLSTGALDTKALGLKAGILRKLHRGGQAVRAASIALEIDPLNFRAMNELRLAHALLGNARGAQDAQDRMAEKMRGEVQAYLELAADYFAAGMWAEATDILRLPIDAEIPFASSYPLVHYYLGYALRQQGETDEAEAAFAAASAAPPGYCFPFRLEGLDVLQAALAINPHDARAYYYLGNLLFDLQPDRAIECWEKSRSLDDTLAAVHRNLGWAHYRVKNDVARAIDCYEDALACSGLDPRLFLELDMLYEVGNVAPEQRLAALEPNHEIVVRRQDSFLREIMVLVLVGKHERAIEHLEANLFHAQEGRDEIHDVYVDAHLLAGLRLMKADRPREALTHFLKADEYPDNLSVGRPKDDPRGPQVAYYTATAYAALGERGRAEPFYRKAAEQRVTDRWPDARFYQARSLAELGRVDQARKIYEELVATGRRLLDEGDSTDFFAKFGQQQTRKARNASAHYLLGLGLLGQGKTEEARRELDNATQMNLAQPWAAYHAKAVAQ